MRKFLPASLLCACAAFSPAQTSPDDAALLREVRAKYDAPFSRNLQSFECAVEFSWKQHWTETFRVGDEGTDQEIAKFIQPIANRVTVTRTDAVVSSGLTEEQEHSLPRGGMAEGLLQHAVSFSLRDWLVASNNTLLPQAGTAVHFDPQPAGYNMQLKLGNFDVTMMLKRDMSLQNMGVVGSPSDRQEFEFQPGPQGFVVSSWTMGEDGNFSPGHRIIFTYTYQTVDGFQLPARVTIHRESHHEVWRYSLSGCKVKKAPG